MKGPIAAADRLLNLAVARADTSMRLLVHDPARARRLYWRAVAGFVLGFAALLAWIHLEPPIAALAGGLLGGYISTAAFAGVRRASAYRVGWVDGRQAVLRVLPQLLNGEIPFEEWMRAHVAHDLQALGYTPTEVFAILDDLERRANGGNER